jgi:hypothetical protein
MTDFMDAMSGFGDMGQEEALPIKPSASDQMEKFRQFDSPIPGQSLTQELGNAPYEQPPQYTELTEFMDYMFDNMSRTPVRRDLLRLLDAGVPVKVILPPMLLHAVSEGKLNMDLAMLALEPLVYMVAGFGYHAGINVVLDQTREDNGLDPRPFERIVNRKRKQSEAPKVIEPKAIDMKRTLVPKKEIT